MTLKYEPQLRKNANGQLEVFDPLRRKWLVVTPEEQVRQTFVHYLTHSLGYPPSLMANEVALTLNGTRRRCDTLVYTNDKRPLMVVEYKRPTVTITARVFDQIARYNSVYGAPWIVVTNGVRHYCCHFNGENYTFRHEIPTYSELLT